MNDKPSPAFYSGLSGLQLNIPKHQFPDPFKETSRLRYYASLFNSIEINSSFYKIPQYKTTAKWAADVPENFRFTFKLWQDITHCKQLIFKEGDVESFMRAIDGVSEKKGCLLIQFPPGLGSENVSGLRLLLNCVARSNSTGWRIAVEFRNRSWYKEEVYDLLQSAGAALVIQDIPKSASPLNAVESGFIYLRFHGPSGNYKGSYPEYFLSEYSEYIGDWLNEGKDVYAYFNNTAGEAFSNLTTLNSMRNEHRQEIIKSNHGTE
jgi:uncharacterized protein YecE (DUF72 family)